MKILTLLVLPIFFLMSSQAFAQANIHPVNYSKEGQRYVDQDESLRDHQAASTQIRDLRKGALLVRLKTRQNTIDAFKEKGYLKMAKKVEKEQQTSNKNLMKAFREHFDFCKVYFFFSDDSDKVLGQTFTGIFLNKDLEKDVSIVSNEKHIFTAEIGSLITDPSITYPDGTESSPTSGMSESVLVIKNHQFEQLRRPFPYYVKISDRFLDKKIDKLNKRLHRFYGNWKK